MTISKCSPIGTSNGDPECEGQTPYRKDWILRMKIGLVQENEPFQGYVDFMAVIFDPCVTDTVQMIQTENPVIDYTLKYAAVLREYSVEVVQKYPLCQLQCYAQKSNTMGIVPAWIKSDTLVTTFQPHPSLKDQIFVIEIQTA